MGNQGPKTDEKGEKKLEGGGERLWNGKRKKGGIERKGRKEKREEGREGEKEGGGKCGMREATKQYLCPSGFPLLSPWMRSRPHCDLEHSLL